MSSSPRDPILPDNFRDLIEVIEHRERQEGAVDLVEEEIAIYGRKVAPFIFEQLYRQIDHDLLFSTDPILVMPDIKEAAGNILRAINAGIHTPSWMIDIISNEVLAYIQAQRPREP
jgi:hypothetical protein